MSDDNKGLIDLRLVVEVLRQHGRFDDEEGEVTNNLQDLIDSLATKEGAGVPVAYVVRDAEGGSLHDFTDYYDADQFWIRNRSRMLKPQFLFCYDAPAAVMPAAPSDAVLSDDQIDALQEEYDCFGECDAPRLHDFARGVERTVRATLSQKAGAVAQCPNCKGTRAPSPLDPDWRGRCECAAPGAAIAAREQRITKADVLRVAKEIGLVGWISDCGQWFEFTDTEHPSKLLIRFAEHYAALASREEAPATPQGKTTSLDRAITFKGKDYTGTLYECIERAYYAGIEDQRAALTQPTTVQQADDSGDLAARLLGRAQYIRDQGGVKSAELMEAAAAALKGMQPGERKEQS